MLLLSGLLAPGEVFAGIVHGLDVYLFLAGMLLLAEVARQQGLFDWLAAIATGHARGSATRLFLWIYAVGVVVTALLSNDATAVVLTPAVAAAARAARVDRPLPYLFICAFVANAASFVLPISNPANLVIYGVHLPTLLQWLARYFLPSLVSVIVTCALLQWTQRRALRQPIAIDLPIPELSSAGKMAALGIAAAVVVLVMSSSLGIPLGLPTAIAGAVTSLIVLLNTRSSPWLQIRDISWGVIPLVAGLFVLVEALDKVGVVRSLARLLQQWAAHSATLAAWASGLLIAVLSNLVNNLPAGLMAGSAVQAAQTPDSITRAVLIGVDLGPNFSVTGSLATILWLAALRREGIHVSASTFLRLGLLMTPPALLLSICVALIT